MKRLLLTGAAALAAVSLTACNVQLSTGEEAKTGSNSGDAARQSAAPAQPAGGGGPAGSQPPSAEVQGEARQNFTVVNNTGHTVMTLNVSPSNDNNWGPDILGSQVLPAGQSAEVTFQRGQAQCQWDIRATYDDGDTTDERGVNLCEVGTVTLTERSGE